MSRLYARTPPPPPTRPQYVFVYSPPSSFYYTISPSSLISFVFPARYNIIITIVIIIWTRCFRFHAVRIIYYCASIYFTRCHTLRRYTYNNILYLTISRRHPSSPHHRPSPLTHRPAPPSLPAVDKSYRVNDDDDDDVCSGGKGCGDGVAILTGYFSFFFTQTPKIYIRPYRYNVKFESLRKNAFLQLAYRRSNPRDSRDKIFFFHFCSRALEVIWPNLILKQT